MQFTAGKKPAVGILYDSDFGATADSVLALALLHGLEGRGQARIVGLTITNSDLGAAQLCDVIEKFYASATTGLAAMFLQGLPIGLADASPNDARKVCRAVLAKTDEAGKAVYAPRVRKLNDTAVPEVILRNALSAQYDGNAAIVSRGPATNLLKLLALPGAKELITAKVRLLAVAGPLDEKLAAGWPTPIAAVPEEVGRALPYPASSIEKDFAYVPAHPVADAYRAFRPMPYDAPTTALAAALYAAAPDKGYFTLRERQMAIDPARKDALLGEYTQLASAKPKPRTFRRPAAEEKEEKDKEKEKEKENKVAP